MAHLGHPGDQEGQPRVVPSEKYAATACRVSDGMRMIPPCFARALERYTSCIGVHFRLTFQEVRSIRKTRNQLYAKNLGRLQERLDVYWIVHNFVRVHFTTRQVPAVALGILDHGFALHELFLIQKAA